MQISIDFMHMSIKNFDIINKILQNKLNTFACNYLTRQLKRKTLNTNYKLTKNC